MFISADGNSAATATPRPPPTPEIGAAPPGNFTVADSSGDGTGVATWDAVAGATGYEIELRVGSAGETTTLSLGKVTTTDFKTHASASNCCVKDEQYSARIRAVQNARQSAWSLWKTFVFNETSTIEATPVPFTVTLDNTSYVYGTGLFWYNLSSSKVVSFSCNIGGASFSCSAGRSSRAVAVGVYTVTACATFGGVMKGAAVTLTVLPAPGPAVIAPLAEAECSPAPDPPPDPAPATDTPVPTQPGDGDGDSRRSPRPRATATRARVGSAPAAAPIAIIATCDPASRLVLTEDHGRFPACDTLMSDSPGLQFRQVRSAPIGRRSALDRGALGAINIRAPGSLSAEICFAGRVAIWWLEAVDSLRPETRLTSIYRDGKTCAFVTRAGTVIVRPGEPALSFPPTPTPTRRARIAGSPTPARFTVNSDSPGIRYRELRQANVGERSALDRGVLGAVEIWGPAGIEAEVCLAGRGRMVWLDAVYNTSWQLPLQSTVNGRQTCARITRAGTVVLLPGAAGDTLTTLAMEAGAPLGECMVTLSHQLNFRAMPGGERLHFVDRWGNAIAGWLPEGVTLTALERTADWFKVDYYGTQGWVSARYVRPEGDCG